MGITVRHDVDPAITGTAAILAGQGEYKRWLMEQQQKMAMQQAQIDAQRQSQILSLKSQREDRDAQRENDWQRWAAEKNYTTERDEWQDYNKTRDRDVDYDRKMALLADERSYAEKQADDDLLRKNAGWEAVKPFEIPPATLPKGEMPGWMQGVGDIVEVGAGFGKTHPHPITGEPEPIVRFRPDGERVIDQLGTYAKDIWDAQPAPLNPDDLDLTAFDKRLIDQLNNQISQIRASNEIPLGAKAQTLTKLQGKLDDVLKNARPKRRADAELEFRTAEDGSTYYRGSGGEWRQARPEPTPRQEKPAYTAAQHASLAKQFYDEAATTRGPDGMKRPISIAESKRMATEFLSSDNGEDQSANAGAPRVDSTKWNAMPDFLRSQLQNRIQQLKAEQADAKRRGDQAALSKTIAEAQDIARQLRGGK